MPTRASRRRVGITPLKARRLARGQTIREVAAETAIHPSSIAKWEVGLARPPRDAERRLASHFGLSIEDLRRPIDLAPALDPRTTERLATAIVERVVERLRVGESS